MLRIPSIPTVNVTPTEEPGAIIVSTRVRFRPQVLGHTMKISQIACLISCLHLRLCFSFEHISAFRFLPLPVLTGERERYGGSTFTHRIAWMPYDGGQPLPRYRNSDRVRGPGFPSAHAQAVGPSEPSV